MNIFMTLIKDEKILDSLGNVVLTNYRIVNTVGSSYEIIIFLQKITSIERHYESSFSALLFGILFSVMGIIGFFLKSFFELPERVMIYMAGVFLISGMAFILICFSTRKHTIIVSPDGGQKLKIEVQRLSNERIEEFITNIQKEIQEGKKHFCTVQKNI